MNKRTLGLKNTTYCASFYTVSYFVLKEYLIAKNISFVIIVAYFSFYRFIAFFCFKAFHSSSCLLFFMIFINFFYLFLPVLQTKTVVFFKHFTMSLFFSFFVFFFFGLFLSFCVTVSFVQAE